MIVVLALTSSSLLMIAAYPFENTFSNVKPLSLYLLFVNSISLIAEPVMYTTQFALLMFVFIVTFTSSFLLRYIEMSCSVAFSSMCDVVNSDNV